MKLDGVLFLAAYTARSQAYAQSMAAHSLSPEFVLLYGKQDSGRPGQAVNSEEQRRDTAVALPDLSEPLLDTCTRQQCEVITTESESVNSGEVADMVRKLSPRLVVFSGYGGEIVSSQILQLGAPFLHMHGGWLPDYRGSTTIYYSILQESNCSVSAILLSSAIDTGPIVARKTYPIPPAGIDVDYLYDPAIRADLLVEVLIRYAQKGAWSDLESQAYDDGKEYFVIHPVLKHLALLAIDNR